MLLIPDIYLPYRFYGFDQSKLKQKLLSDMSCFRLVEMNRVMGAWGDLLWDSKHFGRRMLELRYFIAEAKATFEDRCTLMEKLQRDWKGYDHVTARINSFDILSAQVAENFGFLLMDTNVKYGIDLRKASISKFDGVEFTKEGVVFEVRKCPCCLPELLQIAETSWSQTKVAIDRFHADRNLPQQFADSVYTEWLKNSLSGELADYIIVPRVEGKAAGFLTLKQHADDVGDVTVGLLVLAAVDPSMRGKSIYTNMILLGLRVLQGKAEIVETGTQITNYPVQKAWVQLGLKLVSTTYVFHKWLNTNQKE